MLIMLGKHTGIISTLWQCPAGVAHISTCIARIAHGICCRLCLYYCIRQEDVLDAQSLTNSAEQQLVHEINVRLNLIAKLNDVNAMLFLTTNVAEEWMTNKCCHP